MKIQINQRVLAQRPDRAFPYLAPPTLQPGVVTWIDNKSDEVEIDGKERFPSDQILPYSTDRIRKNQQDRAAFEENLKQARRFRALVQKANGKNIVSLIRQSALRSNLAGLNDDLEYFLGDS